MKQTALLLAAALLTLSAYGQNVLTVTGAKGASVTKKAAAQAKALTAAPAAPVQPGAQVDGGTIIQTDTAPGSYADLAFGKAVAVAPARPQMNVYIPNSIAPDTLVTERVANSLRLTEGTELAVDSLASTDTGAGLVTAAQLTLSKGHFFGHMNKPTAGSVFEVTYPQGVVGVKNGVYDISAKGVVRVLVGQAVVAPIVKTASKAAAPAAPVAVNGGYGYSPATGVVPLSAGDIADLNSFQGAARQVRVSQASTVAADRSVIPLSPTKPGRGRGHGQGGNHDD